MRPVILGGACLIAGMDLEDFRELLRKADVSVVV